MKTPKIQLTKSGFQVGIPKAAPSKAPTAKQSMAKAKALGEIAACTLKEAQSRPLPKGSPQAKRFVLP